MPEVQQGQLEGDQVRRFRSAGSGRRVGGAPLWVVVGILVPATALAAGADFAFEGWPGEGIPKFTVKSAINAPLHIDYSAGSDEIGRCKMSAGSALEYSSSFSVTPEPLTRLAETNIEAEAVSFGKTRFLTSSNYRSGSKRTSMIVAKGEAFDLLQGRAEGMCLFRVKHEIFEASCSTGGLPSQEDWPKSEWWIQADCGAEVGWLQVDQLYSSLTQRRAF